MEGTSYFPLVSSYIALIATAFCCLFVLFAVRLSSSSSSSSVGRIRKSKSRRSGWFGGKRVLCGCSCSCDGSSSSVVEGCDLGLGIIGNGRIGERQEGSLVGVEWQSGSSMMEQLVPEITTHTLSYLDYRSLCRLSMTNSSMRRAANDDNAWKAIYHKDFTVEQDSVIPPNGWKAYYAATRAVVNVNAEFFDIIRERSLPAMGRFWLNADYVQCVHGTGDFFTGYPAVIQSWLIAFSLAESVASLIRDVRVRVLSDMAWVTMKAYDEMEETGPFRVTNIYEFHNGQWFMVHHHSSLDERLEQ